MANQGAVAVLRALLREAKKEAKIVIPSKTLKRAVRQVVIPGTSNGYLEIPHYWAVYVHDGRRAPFGPKKGRYLIWWKNALLDPRGPTPERYSQVKRLSKSQFKKAWKVWNEALRTGGDSPVVIVRQVKKPTVSKPFFSNGMRGFVARANEVGMRAWRAYLFKQLKGVFSVGGFVPAGGTVHAQPIRERILLRF